MMSESSRVGTEINQAICVTISGILQCVYRYEWSLIIGTGMMCSGARTKNKRE